MKLNLNLMLLAILATATSCVASYNDDAKAVNQAHMDEKAKIIKQHHEVETNIHNQAKNEHSLVKKTTKARLANAKQIKDRKERNHQTKHIKKDANAQHRSVEDRKQNRLNNAAEIKKRHLRAAQDRHDRQLNRVRQQHGRPLKPVKTTTRPARTTLN